MPRKRPPCPRCGSTSIAEIFYGLPVLDEELNGALDRKEIVLGGCCVSGDDPRWHCNACEEDFGRPSSRRSGCD